MEEILQQILKKLQVVEDSQVEMRKEFKEEQADMRKDFHGLKVEQAEMRKEMGFYYASMMKKLDETKTELSSEIKHITSIQKQHQHVLEIINEKE
jgi:hypothetical protein